MATAALLLVVSVAIVAFAQSYKEPVTSSAATAPRTLTYACASDLYNARNVLHFVSRPSKCKGTGKKLVKFAADYPVYVCRKEHGGFTASSRARRFPYPTGIRPWGPAGLIRMVSDPSKCAPAAQPNETPVTLPATSSRLFCAAKKGGELRWVTKVSSCDKKEFPVKLAKRVPLGNGNGNGDVTAAPDTAATGENGTTNIDVLANDSGPGNSGGLVVDGTDTTGTVGKVTVNGDNSITYDTDGKFEALKAGQSATDSFKYTARKNPSKSAVGTVTITINGENDAPVAVDDSSSTDEDSTKTISVLSNDTDKEGDTLSAGSLDTTGTEGIATINGDGTIKYDPNHRFDALQGAQTGTDSFKYKANDGSADSNTATVTLTITAVNDAPVLANVESTKLNYLEGSAATAVTSALTVADADNANVHGATVTIGAGRDAADALHFANQNGITGSAYDSGTGVLTLTGSASKANYQTALRSITFDSAGGATGDRTISFRVEDGEAANKDSNVVQRVVTIDKAPVASNDSKTIVEDAAATTIDVLGNDSDGGDGGPKTILSKIDGANGTVVITNGGNDLTYTPALNFCGSDSFTYKLNGGSSGTVSVTVTCVNDAPVNTVPGARTLDEDGNVVFNNAFSVADVDAAPDSIKTTLAVPNGTITVSGGGAAVVSTNGTSSVQITGSLTEVNSKLSAASYAPDANVNGSRTLTMDTDDQGHNGPDGNKTDHDTVAITINAVNDAPVNTMPGAQSTNEDTPLTLSGANAPSIADVDAGSDPIKATVSVSHGTLFVQPAAGLTRSGNDTSSVELNGSRSVINSALDGLKYTPGGDYNGADTLTLVTNDNGNSGSGGALSDTDTVGISVNAVNDGPVNSVPGSQSPAEDAPVTFSTGNGNLISVNDVDVASNDLKVTLSASHGALTLSGTSGLTFTQGDGTDDPQMIFTGTQSSVNNALAGLTFTPALNYEGLAQVQLKTGDQGNNGSGGNLEDIDTIDLNYSAQNDAPVNTVPGAQSVNEDTALPVSGVSIADSDAAGSPVQVTLSVLHGGATIGTAGLTFSAGDGTGDSTMTFTGTVSAVNTALGNLSYQGTLNYNGSDTLTLTTNDQGNTGAGGPKSDSDSIAITVNPVNDAPTATGDAYSVNEDATLSEPASGVLGNDADVDGNTLNAVVVSGPASASSFSLNPDGSFSYKGNANFAGSDSFTYKANDGSLDSNTVTVDITVAALNDDPVNTVPSAQSVSEDTSLVLGAPGLAISDVDAGSSDVKVTLSALNGALTLGGATASLNFTNGDGAGDLTMTFTGKVSDINTALAGSSYQGNLNYNGSDTITLKTEDLGNTGSGGNKIDTDTVAVTVGPVNDGPANTVPGAQSTPEDTARVFSTANSNALSIADVDADSASVQVKLTVTNGTLTLPSLAGLSFTVGDGSADATMTFTGSITTINNRLNGLSYQPSANVSGPDSLQIVTDDLGNTGSGGALSDTDSVAISVGAVNDGPVNTVPGPQTINEDAPINFGSSVTIFDLDADPNDVEVTLGVDHGKLTLGSTVGLTTVSGNNSATVVVTGTQTAVNNALNGLTYAPDANHFGSDTFTITTNDQGNTGTPGALSDIDTVAITLNALNDAPVLDLDDTAGPGQDSNTSFLETVTNDGEAQIAPSVSITDPDDDNIESATIQLVNNPAPDGTAEQLTVNVSAGGATNITVFKAYDNTDRRIELTGSDTKAHYKAVLESIRYKNTAQPPNSTTRDITIVLNDGDVNSNTTTAHVQVIPLNTPPVLDLDTGTAGFDSEATFTEDSTPPSIAPNPSVTDIDAIDTHMESATVTLTDPQNGGLESLTTSAAGLAGTYTITYNSGAGVLSISGHGTKAEYATLLGRVTYNNTSNTPNTADRHVSFTVNDGNADSNEAKALVHVTATNDPPVNSVPGGTSTNEDTPKVFSTANSNALSISDVDAGSNPVQVKLSVDNGTLSLASLTGLTFSDGDGDSDATMTFSGTVTDINDALSAGLTYNPALNFGGSSTLEIVTNDQGNTGGGGAHSDTDTVAIGVTAQNDAPSNTLPGPQATNEDVALVLSLGNANQVQISDVDAGSNSVQVTLTSTNGAITLNGTTGLIFSFGDGIGDSTMTFTGTITNINNALNGMSYLGTLNFNGSAQLTIATNDQGSSGAGGAQSDSDNLAITVNPVNDAPSNTVPGAQSTNEDTAKTFSSGGGNLIAISDVDADTGNVTTQVSVTNGIVTLNGTSGLSVDAGANGSSTVTVTGTLSNVNIALNGLQYTPASNFNGSSTLTVNTSDNGNTGSGGSLSDNGDTVAITVNPVNDAPQNSVPGAQAVDEDTSLVFNGAKLISTSDVDAGASAIQVTLSVLHGGVTLNGTAGLVFSNGDGIGDSTMTFTGSQSAVNTALNGMSYLGTLNYNGPETLTLNVNDQGNTGSGGALSDQDTVAITVNPVNDAPTADNETFGGAGALDDQAIGNTTFQVDDPSDDKPAPSSPNTEIAGDILAGDADVDGPGPVVVQSAGSDAGASNGQTADGGSVTIESDGDFTYLPPASVSCDNGTDTFNYKISDQANSGAGPIPGTAVGTVTINLEGCVWYVNNNAAGNAGTAVQPYDTLQQAETSSTANQTVFVFDGDDTTTGYQTGYLMDAGGRLIGEEAGLVVDADQNRAANTNGPMTPDTLRAANPGAFPTIEATNEDVVVLDDNNEVAGFRLDPAGAGGGIGGVSSDANGSDASGTITSVRILDMNTAGQQPGLELNGTTGTFNISNLTVDNVAVSGGGTGSSAVKLNNAGTVNFLSLGTISLRSTNGAKGLDVLGTNLGSSVFDDITVNGSSDGGVRIGGPGAGEPVTGTVALGDGVGTDLALTTTSGTQPALKIANAGANSVSVPNGGDANLTSVGGPAADITATPGATFGLDSVTADTSGTAEDGINIAGLGTGSFTASGGTLTGGSGVEFDLDGGNGTITYPGTFANTTSGLNARINGRTAGASSNVTFGGPINDITAGAGGGIRLGNVTANTGGTTTFSNSVNKFDTGASDAVSMQSSDGHTLNFTGGNLDIDTTSGAGLTATNSGTLTVTGTGNTIDSTSGTALNVTNTDIGNSDLKFQRISSGNSTAAADPANGIVLNNTANANGRLFIESSGSGTCENGSTNPTSQCTGGLIQNTTASGVVLTSVPGGAELTRVAVTDSGTHGIAASTVAGGIKIASSAFIGNGDTNVGDGTNESGLQYNNVQGVTSLVGSDVIDSQGFNFKIDNNVAGTLNLTVTDDDIKGALSNDGIQVNAENATTIRSNISGNRFDDNKGDAYQAAANLGATNAVHDITFTANTIDGRAGTSTDAGVVISSDQNMALKANVSNNTITNTSVSALVINPCCGASQSNAAAEFDAIVDANHIGNGTANSGSDDGFGIDVSSHTDGSARIAVTNNTINNYGQMGMSLAASEGQQSGGDSTQLTATNNQISQPDSVQSWTGITATVGTSNLNDVILACMDIGGAGSLANTFAGPLGPAAIANFWLSLRFVNSVLQAPGYSGTTLANRKAYFLGRNPTFGSPPPDYTEDGSQNMQGHAGGCTQPTPPTLPVAP
jgi:VCBS repeat-containing protein